MNAPAAMSMYAPCSITVGSVSSWEGGNRGNIRLIALNTVEMYGVRGAQEDVFNRNNENVRSKKKNGLRQIQKLENKTYPEDALGLVLQLKHKENGTK